MPTLEDADHAPARARALGHRPGVLRLHHLLDRPAPAGRSGRAGANTTSCCSTTAAPAMLGTEFQDMLRCIRCGACLNHCPVYQRRRRPRLRLGLSRARWARCSRPSLIGIEKAGHLPNASTFCGRCEEVCPMRIPLPKHDAPLARARVRARPRRRRRRATGLRLWALFARRPGLYRLAHRHRRRALLGLSAAQARTLPQLPLAGGWTGSRDLPAPQGGTFMQQWRPAASPRRAR